MEIGKVEKNIIRLLKDNPGLSDRELADYILGREAPSRYINYSCNVLKSKGVLYRKVRQDGLIGNWLKTNNETYKLALQTELEIESGIMAEKTLKQILANYLASQSWESAITWGINNRGIDIEAKRGNERWIVQVKGSDSFQSSLINNFLCVLGEIIQRMDDPNCKYSVALPDLEQFRRFWERLPPLAKTRMQVTALFVNLQGDVAEVT